MELQQEEVLEPMSPSAQYLRSSTLSLSILGVLELEALIDDSMTMPLLRNVFLPINPRFSSIMVTDEKGGKKWKKVEVNLKDHVKVPIFPSDMTVEYYEECFTEYLSKIATEEYPQNRPLWEIHLFKYPTQNTAENIIFKLHHSLGDGYSVMGALLSCLQRADNPLIPLTFPSRQSSLRPNSRANLLSTLVHTAYDLGRSLIETSLMRDDKSPIRSGEDGVEFKPTITTTATFSMDQLKRIKSRLNVTINDVITGIIILGTRLYMEKASGGSGVAKSTALVLLNTRALEGYKSVDEMIKPDAKMPWGNRFTFLHVSIPKATEAELQNPLAFVTTAHQLIKRQRKSAAVYLTGQLLDFIGKVRGHEATARYVHATLKNTSLVISNMIGPLEQMTLANVLVKGVYFTVSGSPQSLQFTIVSHVGDLRIAMTVEKGFMDPNKLKSCIEYAFEVISKAALESPTVA